MQSAWLVAVCAGRWQLSGIRAAQGAGLQVLALDGDSAAPGLRVADRAAVVDVGDVEAVVAAVRDAGVRARGAASFAAEIGMPSVAALREAFDLPGPRSAMTRLLTDKAAQRERMASRGCDVPRFATLLASAQGADGAELDAALSHTGLPAIVKPTDSSGSRGVALVRTREQARAALPAALKFSRSGRAIIEEYMDGVEYTVESFSSGGKAHSLLITSKRKVEGTGGTVAVELASPEPLAAPIDAVRRAALEAVDALGYESGPGHTELIATGDGRARVVEVAGRGGGFLLAERAVPMASGFDLMAATARAAAGLPVDVAVPREQPIVLRFVPSTPGRVRSVAGIEDASELEGVYAEAFVRAGDRVARAATDGDRLAGIVAVGATPAQARSRADAAEAAIQIQIQSEVDRAERE